MLDITDKEIPILRQVANKLRGRHEGKADSEELKRIYDAGNLEQFSKLSGINEEKLKYELDRLGTLKFNDKEWLRETNEKKTVSKSSKGGRKTPKRAKPGQLWQLGRHLLLCGDATHTEDKKRLLDGVQINAIITDPPWGVDIEGATNARNIKKGQYHMEAQTIENDAIINTRGFTDLIHYSLRDCNQATHCAFYLWIGDVRIMETLEGIKRAGGTFRQGLVWPKPVHVLSRLDYQPKHEYCALGHFGKSKFYGDRSNFTLLPVCKVPDSDRWHLTQKPLELLRLFIRNSTAADGTIYDPFCGSGSTLMAAEQTGRTCRTMELDPTWADATLERFKLLTGTKPELVK